MSLFLAAALLAQTLVESIEVRVVNVDVVVTDRAGKPVTGLTKDDFEILEDRKPQVITNFHEVRQGERQDDRQDDRQAGGLHHNFILFVDNRAMHPVLRKHITGELAKFVDTQLREGDQATVVTWDRVLNIVTPLTGDKAAVQAGIARVAETGSPMATKSEFARVQQECTRNLQLARAGRMPMRTAYEECIAYARQEAQRITTFSRMVLNAVDVAMATVAGVEGKKVLVLAGTEMPVKPGIDMFQWANGLFANHMTGFDAAIARPDSEERTQRQLLEKLGRSANAHGVTLYMISALMPTDSFSAASETGIVDAGGEFLRSSNTEVSHETLAKLTGGVAVPIAKVETLLGTIAADLGSYYSLGYRPSGDAKRDRDITVRAKNRNYTVRARQSYAPKSAEDQMADRVVANIYAPARGNEWQVHIRAGAPRLVEKGKYSVPIEIIAPAAGVTLLPRDGRLLGGFTVYLAVGNAQGALSTTFRHPNSIDIAAAEETGFRREPLVFSAGLTLKEGENLISAGVVDQISGTAGFARTTVNAK